MVGTNYEILLSMDSTFIPLVARGFIPVQYIEWKTYYEFFKWQREQGHKTEKAVMLTCDKFPINRRQVYRIKAWMESIK